jgi:hypothetical protein
MEQHVASPLDDIEVGPAVVVVVAPNAIHARAVRIVHPRHAGLDGNVLEGAVATIAIEMIELTHT